MNPRTYPRTLHGSQAAFRDATYACPLIRPRSSILALFLAWLKGLRS